VHPTLLLGTFTVQYGVYLMMQRPIIALVGVAAVLAAAAAEAARAEAA